MAKVPMLLGAGPMRIEWSPDSQLILTEVARPGRPFERRAPAFVKSHELHNAHHAFHAGPVIFWDNPFCRFKWGKSVCKCLFGILRVTAKTIRKLQMMLVCKSRGYAMPPKITILEEHCKLPRKKDSSHASEDCFRFGA